MSEEIVIDKYWYKAIVGEDKILLVMKTSAGKSGDVFLNIEGVERLRNSTRPVPKFIEATVRTLDGQRQVTVSLEYLNTLTPISRNDESNPAKSYWIYDGYDFCMGENWTPPVAQEKPLEEKPLEEKPLEEKLLEKTPSLPIPEGVTIKSIVLQDNHKANKVRKISKGFWMRYVSDLEIEIQEPKVQENS